MAIPGPSPEPRRRIEHEFTFYTPAPADQALESDPITALQSAVDETGVSQQAPVLKIFHYEPREDEIAPAIKRGPGRPKGSTKKVFGPKRPPGRPPGTGKRQRENAEREAQGLQPEPRRKRGRPAKSTLGKEVWTIERGTFVVPGTGKYATIHPLLATAPGNTSGARASFLGAPVPPSTSTAAAVPVSSSGRQNDPLPPEEFDEDDPQRLLEADDDCGEADGAEAQDDDPEARADGSGLGDDFEEVGTAEEEGDGKEGEVEVEFEDEDEAERSGQRQEQGLGKKKRTVRPVAPFVLREFDKLVSESKNRIDDQPPLYANEYTYWRRGPSLSFALDQSTTLSPSTVYATSLRLFLWDPMARMAKKKKKIPCPHCRTALVRHTNISRPRRVVDFNDSFWLVGYRYRCTKCRTTIRSWDQRILDVLPVTLRLEFPAVLSHRSGLTRTLLEWVRTSTRNGMGGKQLSDALRVQHLVRYEEMRAQYLYHLRERQGMDTWRDEKHMDFPAFEDRGPEGYHGYVPCGQYLNKMYDAMIECHLDEYRQDMAMRTCRIGAGDHSFKIPKRVKKENGKELFNGLHCVSNEYSEVRAMHLVTTKANSQVKIALEALKDSLEMYGLEQPEVWYTDNMADRGMLEDIFPSLRAGVVPPDKYAHLEELSIPDGVRVYVRRGVSAVDATARSIMSDLPDDPNAGELVVGFDSEWNVEVTANGRSRHAGATAIIQIAYKNCVYILQISDMVAEGTLPTQLKTLLAEPRIRKVGRLVNGDLKRLELACRSTNPFTGGVDLAGYAKHRCILATIKKIGLADLSAIFLRKRLNKNDAERISMLWDEESLTERQIRYAATDAYASLCIYSEISKFSTPRPFPCRSSESPPPATPVIIYSGDKTQVVAVGQVSLYASASIFDGIQLNEATTVVDVFHIVLPGAKLTAHRKKALKDFGSPTFSAVVHKKLLRIYVLPHDSSIHPYGLPASTTSNTNSSGPSTRTNSTTTPPITHPPCPSAPDVSAVHRNDTDIPSEPNDRVPLDMAGLADSTEGDALGDHGLLSPANCERDALSAAEGAAIMGDHPVCWDTTIRSRVLKDPFHVCHMFYISVKHGLRVPFARALSRAIFIDDPEDERNIRAWAAGQDPPVTLDYLRSTRSKWVLRRLKRIIPPENILGPRVRKVFDEFGPCKDATTGSTLFDHNCWKTAKSILELIYSGCLSDPPTVPLYSVKGIDKKTGLKVYHCFRGTNRTEGGIHTHLRPHLPSSGTSIQHAQCSMHDWSLCHNQTNGAWNRYGERYRYHHSIWLENLNQEAVLALGDMLIDPRPPPKGHINGNFYVQTSEVIGILPVPPSVQTSCGMRAFDASVDSDRKFHYLARLQRTSKAVLPVLNSREESLFKELMRENPAFNVASGEPNWKTACKVWNAMADRDSQVNYKAVEQLRGEYAQFKVRVNTKATVSLAKDARNRIQAELASVPSRNQIPAVAERDRPTHEPTSGLRDVPSGPESPTPIPLTISAELTVTERPAPPHCPPPNPPSAVPQVETRGSQARPADVRSRMEQLALKRVTDAELERNTVNKRRRGPRTCQKCGSTSCKGRKEVYKCQSRCRDCGNTRCKGRNSRRPGKTCREAWVDN